MNNNVHTCTCGNEITVTGGWSNINSVLRCQECTTTRDTMLQAINAATQGKSVETVYISMAIRHLFDANDFQIDISYRKSEKMNGLLFMVEVA